MQKQQSLKRLKRNQSYEHFILEKFRPFLTLRFNNLHIFIPTNYPNFSVNMKYIHNHYFLTNLQTRFFIEYLFIFTESASRRCSEDGLWYDYDGTESEGVGWTNFTSCFSQELWDKLEEQANKTGKFLFIILSQLDAF